MGMYDQNERPSGSSGSGLGARLLVAIVIALIAFFMYTSQVEENPLTGEKQHVSLTPKEEIMLGLESAPEMAYKMGGEVPDNNPHAIEVKRIGQYIVQNTDAKKGPWQFKFHLLGDPKTVNAFALPGGQIFITSGLYDKLQTEAQLAGVLSHEMGHVIERHTAQQMAKGQLGQMLVVAVGAAAQGDQYQTTNSPMMIAAMVNQMMQLRYSRKDESQADIWGLKLMTQVGFNPKAMIEVMEILKAVEGRGGNLEMFQTHPDPDRRIQQIQAYLKEHPADANLSNGKPLPH